MAIALYEGLALVLPDLEERRIQTLILGGTLGGLGALIHMDSMPVASGLPCFYAARRSALLRWSLARATSSRRRAAGKAPSSLRSTRASRC